MDAAVAFLSAGTLFSGIDAPEVAAPWLDWRWRAEIDPFANAVSKHHRPGVPNLGDVSKIDGSGIEPVQLLVFGSPCQSFSVAGKRLGLDDPRGNLALVALGLARQLRPEWLVFENVPGLLSSDGGRDFGAFLGLLGQCGYGWAYRVLDAQHFGVPQRRRRIFVVGHLGDWRRAAAVLFERESLSGHPAPRRETGEGIARPVASCSEGSSGYRNDADTADNLILPTLTTELGIAGAGRTHDEYITLAHDLAPAMTTRTGTGTGNNGMDEMIVAHSLRGDGFDAGEDGTGRGTPLVPVAFNWQSGGDCRGLGPQSVTMALSREQTPATLRGSAVRRLTPVECARLQGFPDDYLTSVTWRGKCPPPDGPMYRALGNSMAVPVMRWILERVHLAAHLTSLAA